MRKLIILAGAFLALAFPAAAQVVSAPVGCIAGVACAAGTMVGGGATLSVGTFAWTGTATFNNGLNAGTVNVTSSGTPVNGINMSGAGTLGFNSNSVLRFTTNSTGMRSATASGVMIATAAASGTVPTLIPNQAASTTGLGAQASGNLSLIVGGAEISRVTATATTQIVGLTVLKGYTFSTLPTGITGGAAYITDAVACTFGATPVGSGAVFCPVIYNGTAWVAG